VDQRRVLPRKPDANLTDPDWRIIKTRSGWIQGFQRPVSRHRRLPHPHRAGEYQPMITAAQASVEHVNTTTGTDSTGTSAART
jgi:hypothetical protein